MLNRFRFSAKDILMDNGLLPRDNTSSFKLEDYELFMRTFNSSAMNIMQMKHCSLSEELDNVSNDSSVNSLGVRL